MSILIGTLRMGRAQAEARMLDTCKVEHDTGETTRVGLKDVPVYDTVYTGKCRVKGAGTQPRITGLAGQNIAIEKPELHLPIATSGNVRTGDRVTVTAVDADAGDAALVDKVMFIDGDALDSQATARRFPVRAGS